MLSNLSVPELLAATEALNIGKAFLLLDQPACSVNAGRTAATAQIESLRSYAETTARSHHARRTRECSCVIAEVGVLPQRCCSTPSDCRCWGSSPFVTMFPDVGSNIA